MATSKNQCTGCKKRFPVGDLKVVTAGKFHSESCMKSWANAHTDKLLAKVRKLTKKEDNLRKRKFQASDLKLRKKAAKDACHAYIRARDYGKPCICCNRPYKEDFQAGHFLESGNNPDIRYDEDNIHGQSKYCNVYQGGCSDDYRGNLIKKVGLITVKRLESMKGGTVKRTADDYQEIEQYYKNKLKDLISSK